MCQPTKARQKALESLCKEVDFVLVVGGHNSNNSRQLVEKARRSGCRSERVTRSGEIDIEWFSDARVVGVTAGTSTLEESVEEVVGHLESLGGRREELPRPETAGAFSGKKLAV